ncbi:alpha-ketoglutarate-dependent dioxygenase AlkB [Luteimonas mephitis]|uniref:alpha-ketoglutarate-dependent dioxygenase AlkB n=1 Tax=Luteimonas mephitis TaxID=83615 RepID=UPI00047A9748|nr:alpha-ketoglutarate-dependent dioxygenase AlkB [Luteimonas mephitis]
MDLFASPMTQLLDDAEGGVRYWPSFVDAATADAWFEALQGAEWKSQRRMMYDREVDVPRLVASYWLDGLPPDCPLPLPGMLARVQAQVPAPFNAAGMNLYRDGRDSVAMHHDTLHMLVPGQPIALVSLGDARRMRIRSQACHREAVDVALAHGSLLAMSHASQLTHEHGIPKTARPMGPRMSVVFRVRPPR